MKQKNNTVCYANGATMEESKQVALLGGKLRVQAPRCGTGPQEPCPPKSAHSNKDPPAKASLLLGCRPTISFNASLQSTGTV